MTKYKDIKDFYERCEEHPDHQSGMISYAMIERRLREEIEELRQYIERRKWVGLTVEEIETFVAHLYPLPEKPVRERLRAIEVKLKERNT